MFNPSDSCAMGALIAVLQAQRMAAEQQRMSIQNNPEYPNRNQGTANSGSANRRGAGAPAEFIRDEDSIGSLYNDIFDEP